MPTNPKGGRAVRGQRAPKLDFDVPEGIIEAATPKDSGHCMIADSLKAAMPHATSVSVDLATIRFTDRKARRRYIYLTPAPAQAALLDFDQGVKPAPFRVRAFAAQIVEMQERTPAPAPEIVETKPDGTVVPVEAEAKPKKRQHVVANPADSTSEPDGKRGKRVPIKVGGRPIPTGALATGSGLNKRSPAVRTGRVRRFGLKTMGH